MVLVLLAPACGTSETSPSSDPIGDPSGAWQLVAGSSGGVALPVPADHPITLHLDEPSTFGGFSACNSYGGEFRLTATGIDMGAIDQTLRGCDDALQVAERAYLDALLRITAIDRDGRHLILSGPEIELRYEKLAPPPTAEIVDTAWLLESVRVRGVAVAAAGEPATLLVRSDGTFEGATGCRSFEGQWVEEGARLVATAMTMQDVACLEALRSQDSHVVNVVGDGFVPSIEGDLLTLQDPGGVGLIYRSLDR